LFLKGEEMAGKVLITGGAGFIGSHLADELLARGYQVRILDNLSEQVHGGAGKKPSYLAREAELIVADIRDSEAVMESLDGIDAVFHLAASVGVGQSMYEIARYTSVNNLGTAVLLEALIEHPVKRLVVASSMSIYGEGLYSTASGKLCHEAARSLEQLKQGIWELRNGTGEELTPVPTPETKIPCLSSIYALSKYDQERMCLMTGAAYGIPAVALRFFNVYGTRQSLSNPYTGVLSIFASRLLNNNPPVIYEDGNQMRDFVHVKDVARAAVLALESSQSPGKVFNIGSGVPHTITELARKMAVSLNRHYIEPEITGKYRIGDIRHCFADITLAKETFGYEPRMGFEDGILELTGWLEDQEAVDKIGHANRELALRGLMV
jgi:dTDP-L-rhamnose 4-epimerase